MIRRWSLLFPCLAVLVFGCARPVETQTLPLQPGDVVHPEISIAPREPWHTGDSLSVGVLLRGERPNGESYYVKDADVEIERVVVGAQITFLNGEQKVGDRLDISMVHDC